MADPLHSAGLVPDPQVGLDAALPADLVDLYSVAGRLRRSLEALKREARRGAFPAIYSLGSGVYSVRASELAAWVERRRIEGPAPGDVPARKVKRLEPRTPSRGR